jgi:hypothetical protein
MIGLTLSGVSLSRAVGSGLMAALSWRGGFLSDDRWRNQRRTGGSGSRREITDLSAGGIPIRRYVASWRCTSSTFLALRSAQAIDGRTAGATPERTWYLFRHREMLYAVYLRGTATQPARAESHTGGIVSATRSDTPQREVFGYMFEKASLAAEPPYGIEP